MNGKEFRLARFMASSPKTVVSAIDHGGFMGPIDGLIDPRETCTKLMASDAVLMMPGMIPVVADQFTGPGAPLIITRLLWQSTYCFQWKYHEARHRPMQTVARAVARGADMVLASLTLCSGSEKADAENAGMFSECVQQADELGIPIIGEFFPARTESMSMEELHGMIKIGCRIISELGANMVKTFYTGDRFAEITEATPIPILVLGAEKTPTERDALRLAANAANAGARGIVFGRNIVQSRNPAGFVDAVKAVMTGKANIDEALKANGLE